MSQGRRLVKVNVPRITIPSVPSALIKTGKEDDPADFLLSNTKYHDCHLTVGDPCGNDVERIGVSSSHLIAHSSVFRFMLAESELADPTGVNTHIEDVSPATFKLMLRHIYGGKLPKMTAVEAAQLSLCAKRFHIQHLAEKATELIKRTEMTPPVIKYNTLQPHDLGEMKKFKLDIEEKVRENYTCKGNKQHQICSNLIISPKVNIEIHTMTMRSVSVRARDYGPFDLIVVIHVHKSSGGLLNKTEEVVIDTNVLPDLDIDFRVMKGNCVSTHEKDKTPLILEAGETYSLAVNVHLMDKNCASYIAGLLVNGGGNESITIAGQHLTIRFKEFLHILKITYSIV